MGKVGKIQGVYRCCFIMPESAKSVEVKSWRLGKQNRLSRLFEEKNFQNYCQ